MHKSCAGLTWRDLLIWLRTLVLLLCGGASAMAGANQRGEIHLLLSEPTPVYNQLAEAFKSRVGGRFGVQQYLLSYLKDEALRDMDRRGHLIVPVGARAVRRVAASLPGSASVLALLVPKATMDGLRLGSEKENRVSAVYLDQPIQRSLRLINLLRPDPTRLGILVSNEEMGSVRSFRDEAARRGIQVQAEAAESAQEVAEALRRMLPHVDMLLLLPDSSVVNETNARLVLVSSFRQQVPVVAFSRGLVNAGAIAAVVSGPADIGEEGAAIAAKWNPATGHLPPPRHASGFSVAVNHQVAQSMGLEVPGEEEVGRRLREKE